MLIKQLSIMWHTEVPLSGIYLFWHLNKLNWIKKTFYLLCEIKMKHIRDKLRSFWLDCWVCEIRKNRVWVDSLFSFEIGIFYNQISSRSRELVFRWRILVSSISGFSLKSPSCSRSITRKVIINLFEVNHVEG